MYCILYVVESVFCFERNLVSVRKEIVLIAAHVMD